MHHPPFGRCAAGAGPSAAYLEPRWYACYTRGRHEKRVATLLRERGIESFLPVQEREEQWSDRRKQVGWPLFPSYVFGRFTLGDLSRVLATHGIVEIVRTGSAPAAIADGEIENVRRFAEALRMHGIPAEAEPFLEVGERVRVAAAPLCGVEGIVVKRRGRARVLVGLRAVGQGLSVELDAAALLPLNAEGVQ